MKFTSRDRDFRKASKVSSQESESARMPFGPGQRAHALLSFLLSGGAFTLVILLMLSSGSSSSNIYFPLLTFDTSHVADNILVFEATNASSTINDTLSELMLGVENIFNLEPADVAADLQGFETDFIKNLTDTLGVRDGYQLHFQRICDGYFQNGSDPNSLDVKTCTSLLSSSSDHGAAFDSLYQIPESFVIGNINITFPTSNSVAKTIAAYERTVIGISTAEFAFGVIGLIGAGLVLVFTPVVIILPRSKFAVVMSVLGAWLSSGAFFIMALIISIVIAVVYNLIDQFGETLQVSATIGADALALAWVAWALMTIVSWYWTLVWLVETREFTFQKKRRTAAEIGNWRGFKSELRRNLSLEKNGS